MITGEHLRTLRHRLNLTQREMALRLGLSPNHLAKIERLEKRVMPQTEIIAGLLAQASNPKRRARP